MGLILAVELPVLKATLILSENKALRCITSRLALALKATEKAHLQSLQSLKILHTAEALLTAPQQVAK